MTASTQPLPAPTGGQPSPAATKSAASEDILICTPVDELIAQIRTLVRWIWALRWWLMLGLVAGGSGGALLGITLLRSHTAYGMFSILAAQHENPLGKFSREAIRFFHAPVNIFPSEALVAKTLERLDGKPPTPNQIFETRRKLDISDFGRDVYEVSFRDRDANRATHFLNTHIQIYSENEIQKNLDTLRLEVERIKSTLIAVVARMNHNQECTRAFRTENADALPEFAQEHLQNLRGLERKVALLEAESADVAIENQHLEAQLKSEPVTIQVETRERREVVDPISAATARLQVVRLQIAELKARGLREAHPGLKRLLAEQVLLLENPDLAPAMAAAARPNGDPLTTPATAASLMQRLGGRAAPPIASGGPQGEGASMVVENRPNERRAQMQNRVDILSVKTDQLRRQLSDAQTQLAKARGIVVNMPLLEKRFAELNRSQTADLNTFQQVSTVLEMAEFQLKLEQDSAPSRLELFNPPRLRFSSLMMKMLAATVTGAMVGITVVAVIWSLVSLRRLVWPQGFVKGLAQDAMGPGTP